MTALGRAEFEAALKEHINAWASSALDGGRVKAARDHLFAIYDALRAERDALTADNDRLRVRLEWDVAEAMALVLSHEAHIEKLTADNDRLRAALTNANGILTNLADLDRMVPGSRYAAHVVEARNEIRAALAPREAVYDGRPGFLGSKPREAP